MKSAKIIIYSTGKPVFIQRQRMLEPIQKQTNPLIFQETSKTY